MSALAEEYAGRTVELRHNDALGAVNHECTLLGHVGYLAQVHVLYFGGEIFVVGVGARQFQLGLKRHAVRVTALKTLFDCVAWRVDVVVEELEIEVVAGVGDREVLCEHFVKTFVSTMFRRSVQLEEIAERFQLHFEEVGVRKGILYRGKVNAGFVYRS